MSDPNQQPLLTVEGLTKVFRQPGLRGQRGLELVAARDVTFTLDSGQSLAIVGESGSGKTTVARMLVGLETVTGGTIRFAGRDRTAPPRRSAERRRRGREIQIVFQDPYGSLDPRQGIANGLDEIVRLHFSLPAKLRAGRVASLLEQVGLGAREGEARPRELSGGQRQRVAIARALAAEPSVMILDEAVSALDVSIQAQILNLLADIRQQTGIAYIVISHDLAVIRQITDAVIVMYRGAVVERAATAELLARPSHPYTSLLLDSIPRPGWKPATRPAPRAEQRADECPFRARCPQAHQRCLTEPPLLGPDAHRARCWLADAG